MYISQVRVRDVRGFHDSRNVELDFTRPGGTHAGWTVIAGRNGSGKTSLLRAIALAISGPGVARNLVPDFDNWVSVGKSSGTAEVQLVHDPDYDRFGTTGGRNPARSFWAGLEWSLPSENELTIRRSLQPSLTESIPKGPKSVRRGPWQDNPSGWFSAAYGPFRRLAGGGGETQRLMLSPGPVARLVSLFHEDASLAEGVTWLIEQHLRSLENRPGADELRAFSLAILGDGLLPGDYQVKEVNSEGLWVEHDGYKFPLREMSDGVRAIASLVVDILKQLNDAYGGLHIDYGHVRPTVDLPGVVIIDEIDAHLHVSWQKRIGRWLKDHFPQIQFIVTTHSPYICQDADLGGLIKLPGYNDLGSPRVVDDDLYERVVYGTGDDAIVSDLFGIDSPYSVEAERLRSELVALEAEIVQNGGDENKKKRYEWLTEVLTSSTFSRSVELAARFLDKSGTLF